jgi:LysM domain
MHTKRPPSTSSAGPVSLGVLIAFLALFGAGLYKVVGLPHAPNPPLQLPDPASLEALLRSSHPPLDGAIYVVGMLGWAIWAWLVLSLVLEVGIAAGERVAAGTAVIRGASALADLLSAPLVRKAVRTSLAGGMMARVALAGVPTAAAAPLERPAVVVSVSSPSSSQPTHELHFWASSDDVALDIPAGAIAYTVQPGDNLVRIAERFYANGDKWHLLYETNQGRQMADGRIFDRAGVIQPGWRLIVPEPTSAIETDADGQRWYIVRRGDSSAGISARLLGDESRWAPAVCRQRGGIAGRVARTARPASDLARSASSSAGGCCV